VNYHIVFVDRKNINIIDIKLLQSHLVRKMNIKQAFVFILGLIILAIMGTLPLWWDTMAPSILGFPAYLMGEIDAYIKAVKWLIDQIFG
jgi:hypothetical protein